MKDKTDNSDHDAYIDMQGIDDKQSISAKPFISCRNFLRGVGAFTFLISIRGHGEHF